MRRSSNGAKNTRFTHPHAHICRHAHENPQNRAAVYHYAAHNCLPSHQRPPTAAYAPDCQTSPTFSRFLSKPFAWVGCSNSMQDFFFGLQGGTKNRQNVPLGGLPRGKKRMPPLGLQGQGSPLEGSTRGSLGRELARRFSGDFGRTMIRVC